MDIPSAGVRIAKHELRMYGRAVKALINSTISKDCGTLFHREPRSPSPFLFYPRSLALSVFLFLFAIATNQSAVHSDRAMVSTRSRTARMLVARVLKVVISRTVNALRFFRLFSQANIMRARDRNPNRVSCHRKYAMTSGLKFRPDNPFTRERDENLPGGSLNYAEH